MTSLEGRRHFRHAQHSEQNKCAKFRDYRSNTLPPSNGRTAPIIRYAVDDVTMEVYA
ncbi:hypothetical protein DPMN_131566 [Dreissena polymorpha]|uniref:Uncharacterized protein n=1 Tax=Dreissena polymorpha TaxID=45954 RepID=A0A9D4H4W6_DREPO|nr:hypothetical protein DPMN_131566 [Dreissena polymorpha]